MKKVKQQFQIFLFCKFLLTIEEEIPYSFMGQNIDTKSSQGQREKVRFQANLTGEHKWKKTPKFYQKRIFQYIKQIVHNA